MEQTRFQLADVNNSLRHLLGSAAHTRPSERLISTDFIRNCRWVARRWWERLISQTSVLWWDSEPVSGSFRCFPLNSSQSCNATKMIITKEITFYFHFTFVHIKQTEITNIHQRCLRVIWGFRLQRCCTDTKDPGNHQLSATSPTFYILTSVH